MEYLQNQIIGSSIKYQYINGTDPGNSTIFRKQVLDSFDNNEVKPENIQLHIGKVPVFAAGNSDGLKLNLYWPRPSDSCIKLC